MHRRTREPICFLDRSQISSTRATRRSVPSRGNCRLAIKVVQFDVFLQGSAGCLPGCSVPLDVQPYSPSMRRSRASMTGPPRR